MFQSKLFLKTKKNIAKNLNSSGQKIFIKGDYIDQLMQGVFSFLPLGWKIHRKIEKIIREEMNAIGAQELYMPALQPRTIWEETKRWKNMDPPLFKFKDRHKKDLTIASTHEEVITDLVRKRVNSYKDLPLALYQIQLKFRNEMRAYAGLLRTREFIMKDLYSFHSSIKDLEKFYEIVKRAYLKIFKKCGLKVFSIEAASGTIGGSLSHEFVMISDIGEDKAYICENCEFGANTEKISNLKKCPKCNRKISLKKCIELGHTFNLGDKYSKAMKAKFKDKNGKEKFILMGCYGIGIGRLMAAVVENYAKKDKMVWPEDIAPFDLHLLVLYTNNKEKNKKLKKEADKLYKKAKDIKIDILYDDREDKSPGEKFADADLIGIRKRLVLGQKFLEKKFLELKFIDSNKIRFLKISDFINLIKKNKKF